MFLLPSPFAECSASRLRALRTSCARAAYSCVRMRADAVLSLLCLSSMFMVSSDNLHLNPEMQHACMCIQPAARGVSCSLLAHPHVSIVVQFDYQDPPHSSLHSSHAGMSLIYIIHIHLLFPHIKLLFVHHHLIV